MSRILKRFKSDRADGVLIFFIISIPMFMIILGFAINVNSSVHAKAEHNAIGQLSAQTSISHLSSNGSLGNSAVEAFVIEYRKQAASSLPVADQCKKMTVGDTKRTMPYMVVQLETGRGRNEVGASQTWAIEGNGAIPKNTLNSSKFRVLTAKVYTASTNNFSGFGLPACQLHETNVSAIAFGSQADL